MNFFPAALAACLLGACASSNKTEDRPKKTDESRIVGRIASIPQDRRFVLIQSYGTWDIPTGTILISQGPEGRTANLFATGEKLGQYAAADLRSGTLEVGDAVIHRPALSPALSPAEASEEFKVPESEAKDEPQAAPAADQ